ncbi:MAG: arginine--tRNA ligase [Puniceicoccales bacterium]|jgi:arginyl-tRNA synthetase|nr:arginine--tRNA ligase [Puniceicoccales bacterium]
MEFFLEAYLSKLVKEAALTLPVFDATFDPEIRLADIRFGDFQANGLLAYLGEKKEDPRMWAQKLADLFAVHDSLFDVSVAGPGFLNFSLKDTALMQWLCKFHTTSSYQKIYRSTFFGHVVVIDYSSPNTAKCMHVGHLRSLVIGEALQRLIRFGGAIVVRDNHIGNWGTQFGILLMQIKTSQYVFNNNPEETVESLENLYQAGVLKTKENATALTQARQELVKLQQGDMENVAIWERINRLSCRSFDRIYQRMGVEFDYVLGESFYRNKVEAVYDELTNCGLATVDQGALVVFHPEHPRFCKQAFLVRKSDGASNYASTDLATVKYRVQELRARDIIYVTDCRQRDHFEQLFLTVKKWFQAVDYRVPNMYHVYFGTVLDADGKAIKTREGRPIRLHTLLNEAVKRAYNLIQEKSPNLSEDEKRKVAEVVGLGAIKYADLSQERTGNYRFEWDKMINFDGNTAPYLLYAIARIHAIFRKLNFNPDTVDFFELQDVQSFSTATERALAKKLIAFPSALDLTIRELKPHWLCRYLFDLAGTFSAFYNADKIIVEDEGDIQQMRLLLCSATLSTLEMGLHLLGLDTLERM